MHFQRDVRVLLAPQAHARQQPALRDIGLADRQTHPAYTLGVMDHERGRWS